MDKDTKKEFDKLGQMITHGFEATATKTDVKRLDERIDGVDRRIDSVDKRISNFELNVNARFDILERSIRGFVTQEAPVLQSFALSTG